MEQEDQDNAILAWLTGGHSTETDEELDAPTGPCPPNDHVDAGLRALGYNYHERLRLRRGRSKPRNEAKHRAATAKRFEYYISEKLPGRTDAEIAAFVAAWVKLTNYDLDLGQRWWSAGIDPGQPDQLASALAAGFSIEDLGQVVRGRTIAEYLQDGHSLAWCTRALHWQRPA